MPNTFRCQCGAIELCCHGRPSGWLIKPGIGGAIAFCHECRVVEDEKDRLELIRRKEIDMRVEAYRNKLEQEITVESIRQAELLFYNRLKFTKIE